MSRSQWTQLTDDQLLAQCAVDTYRASGPGGQKRNKTSSAVRLRHTPSGLLVIAEESRSQHENKAKALKRIRQALYLQLRESVVFDDEVDKKLDKTAAIIAVKNRAGRLDVGRKDPRFWPAAGVVLDVLEAVQAKVSEAAKLLTVSTGNLIDFLEQDPKIWEAVNQMRIRHGHKTLKQEG